MATITAAHSRPPPTSGMTSREMHAAPQPPSSSPTFFSSVYAVEVERDEVWVQQLQQEQRDRFAQQANLMHKDFLAELDRAGPFASPETRASLQAQYDERLEQMRAMQQEELDQHIEMERQERLWSLGLEDESWDGWNRVIQDQTAIYDNIQREAATDKDTGVQEQIRENAREAEETGRRSDEWQNTEYQRVVDRGRWGEHQRLTNAHVSERRQRDIAEAESQAAQARSREAHLRETLSQQSESLPSSGPDGVFSTVSGNADTPPSSVYTERWRPPPSVSVPAPAEEARRSFGTDRSSPPDDVRRPSPARPSPLSNNPTSNTMAYARGDESIRPEVWIPPEATREPMRKGSTLFDGREPARKTSGASNAQGLSREPSVQFRSSAQEEPVRKAHQTSTSSQPPQQPPNAPSLRTAPLPTSHPPYAPPPQQQQPQPQSQSYIRTSTQGRPPAPPPPQTTNTIPQARKHETSTPPRPATTSARPAATPSPISVRPAATSSPTSARPAATPSSTSARPAQATRRAPAPAPAASFAKPPTTPVRPQENYSDPTEERRRKLREEYTGREAQRIEEERRRREEEANERRAEEARRRGAEKRRAEEEAREAERRESERRARAAGIPKAVPAMAVDIPELWAAYENQWAAMASATQLRFRSIPWPVSVQVTEPSGLLPVQIAGFVLNPGHSQGKARKDRLKEALLRWHPDRFETKWLRKVVEEEREAVKEGVGLVVRALNELLNAEGTFAA